LPPVRRAVAGVPGLVDYGAGVGRWDGLGLGSSSGAPPLPPPLGMGGWGCDEGAMPSHFGFGCETSAAPAPPAGYMLAPSQSVGQPFAGGHPQAGAGGQGFDPYLGTGMGSSIDPNRRRVAAEIYWSIRRQAVSIRNYMTQLYQGPKTGREFEDLWTAAEVVDLELDRAYRFGGLPCVNSTLASSDALEHHLSRIGAQIAFLRHRDPRMYRELITCRTPGSSDVIPEWRIREARDASKAEFQEEQRIRGGRPNPKAADDEGGGGAGRRVRFRKKDGATPAAAAAGGAR
jgi:hypothetical protein